MALIPLIQPPFMKLLTTKKERQVVMKQTREVSKTEKIIFPIVVTIFVAILLPSTAPLIGCLMLGNLFRECGVTARLSDTVQNALMNIVTIMLSTAVGATMVASSFLSVNTLKIIALGVFAFILSTVGGLLMGKILYVVTKGKVNPLIGLRRCLRRSHGCPVSQVWAGSTIPAITCCARQGPKVAGVIGSAIGAGSCCPYSAAKPSICKRPAGKRSGPDRSA